MSRSTPILAVLLGVSVLANAMLVVRLSRKSDPETPSARRAPGSAERSARPGEGASLQESLDQERRKTDELKAQVLRLEADKKVLAQESPAPGKADKLAVFRDKLRKLMKMMKDPAAKAGAVDPENMVEFSETFMEFFKIAAMRGKEPKIYADYLHAFYEVGLEGEGSALTEAQSSSLSKLFQDMGQELSRIPPTPTGEKLMKEIEIEGAAMRRVHDLLGEAQRAALAKDNMGAMSAGNMLSMSYISKSGAAEQIVQNWSQAYQLEPAQIAQAKVAAQAYVDAMSRLDADKKGGPANPFNQQGSPEFYDARLRSVREQLAALNLLQASMTPAQQERVRTQTMREFILYDTQALQNQISPPAEK
jgi:hypothetical protein